VRAVLKLGVYRCLHMLVVMLVGYCSTSARQCGRRDQRATWECHCCMNWQVGSTGVLGAVSHNSSAVLRPGFLPSVVHQWCFAVLAGSAGQGRVLLQVVC
jgi:hypothetical protein